MELVRLGVVYVHLIACCVAVGLILTSDLKMLKHLITGNPAYQHDSAHLDSLKSTILNALIALWITGILIVGMDSYDKGYSYFLNPKIQAKIAMVVLLTINGAILHHVVMPSMKRAGSLLEMSSNDRLLACFAGVVSGVSWFYAAMLGVGRPLAWKYSLIELLAAYPFFIAIGFAMLVMLTVLAKTRSDANYLATTGDGMSF